MNIDQPKPKRQNRTIPLHLGNTLTEYETIYLSDAGLKALIRRVEVADRIDWGCLATGHEAGCPRQLRFTHHDSYTRTAKHYNGGQSEVVIHRVRCLDCGAVFSVQPSFIIRYKRYDTDAVEKLMTLVFITEDSYRMAGVSQSLALDEQQAGTWAALESYQDQAIQPLALWRLGQWLGQLSPAQLNLALGVAPPRSSLKLHMLLVGRHNMRLDIPGQHISQRIRIPLPQRVQSSGFQFPFSTTWWMTTLVAYGLQY